MNLEARHRPPTIPLTHAEDPDRCRAGA
jgi:hypothetical protein